MHTVRGVGYVLREPMSFRRRLALVLRAPRSRSSVVLGSRARLRGRARHAARRRSTTSLRAPGRPTAAPRPAARPGAGPGATRCCSTGEPPVVHADRSAATRVRGTRAGAGAARRPTRTLRAVADGEREPFFADRTIDGVARARLTSAAARRTRDLRRPAADRGRQRARARCARRSGCSRWPGSRSRCCSRRLATRTAVRPVAELTDDRRARRHARATSRAGSTPQGDDEVSRLATRVQHDARGARATPSARSASSSPTPRTSCARRSPRCARTSRCWRAAARSTRGDRERLRARPRRPARGADRAGRRPRRARPRRGAASRAGRGRAARRARRGGGRARARGTRPDVDVRDRARAGARAAACPARLDRAVANLLDNAAKWSPPGATVDVRLRDGELTVRDHGPGIAAEDRRTSSTASTAPTRRAAGPGSGLGLAIVRQVAEAHGGDGRAPEAADGGGALLRLRAAGPLSKFLGSAEGASHRAAARLRA